VSSGTMVSTNVWRSIYLKLVEYNSY
jgi:hypothetical protein